MSAEIVVTSDERLGFASASKLPLIFACAGCLELEAVAASQSVRVDDSNPAAQRGNLIHSANESGDVSDLDDADVATVEQIRATEERLITEWLAETGHTLENATIYREVRYWYLNYFSGKVDVLIVNHANNTCFIGDAKSGRRAVSNTGNWQLRGLAVAVAFNFPETKSVRTAIIQPFAKEQPVCQYSIEQLNVAAERIRTRLNMPMGQPRTPGTHCRFCAGRAICPEAKKSMSVVIGARSLNWDIVTVPEKVQLFKAASLAEDCAKLIKDTIKADLAADPDAIPGLKKAKDQAPVTITNPAVVAQKCVDTYYHKHGTALEDYQFDILFNFMAASKLSKAEALRIIRETLGGSKSDAERFLLVECADAVKEGFRAGSVSVVEEPAK